MPAHTPGPIFIDEIMNFSTPNTPRSGLALGVDELSDTFETPAQALLNLLARHSVERRDFKNLSAKP